MSTLQPPRRSRSSSTSSTANDIVFAFAELKGPVWDQLKRYGLAQRIGDDHRFPTIGTAVKAYVHRTGTHWVDPVPD